MKKIGREKIARKVVKIAILIVILSIICQIFVSLFPWISISENDYVKEDLHFNFEMIIKSNDEQISNLAGDLNLIILSFWSLIILGLLSFLGAIIHISKKISTVGYILLSIGFATLIFSIIAIYFQFIVIGKIEDIDTINASAISPFFKYYYILLIYSFIIFILSVLYSRIIISYSVTRFLDLKEDRKNKKEQKAILFDNIINTEFNQDFKNEALKEKVAIERNHSKIEMQKTIETKKIVNPEIEEKHKEIEQFLDGQDPDKEKQTIEGKPLEIDKKETLIKEKSKDIDNKTDKENFNEIKQLQKEVIVFSSEKNKLKPKDSYEPTVSESFEKALSSAIQKKHATKDKVDNSKENTKETKKEVKAKKPQKDKIDSSY